HSATQREREGLDSDKYPLVGSRSASTERFDNSHRRNVVPVSYARNPVYKGSSGRSRRRSGAVRQHSATMSTRSASSAFANTDHRPLPRAAVKSAGAAAALGPRDEIPPDLV